MQIRVLMFGVLAQRTGVRELTLALPAGATVGSALDELSGRYTDVAAMRALLATAVDMSYVDAGHVLRDGDELALIPPVSGG